MKSDRQLTPAARQWPAEGLARVPYWVYSRPRHLRDGAGAHLPRARPGISSASRPSCRGPTPTAARLSARCRWWSRATRTARCTPSRTAARTAARCSCSTRAARPSDIICVYHNWSYDLGGNLTGVAFRKGIGGKGGMPADARPDEHPPRKLRVATLAGLVFGTLSADDAAARELSRARDRHAHPPRDARAGASSSAATARCCRATGSSTWRT